MNLEGRQKVVSIAVVTREDDVEDCGCGDEPEIEENNENQFEE